MTKETPNTPRARLFVALDLPDALRGGIVAWGREELRDPALRVVVPEALHITLAFLGLLPEKEVEPLAEVLQGVRAPAPSIELGEPTAKPSMRHPRLFALPARSPGAGILQAELQDALVDKGLYKAEKRPFWPHVTVARVKSAEKGRGRPAPVKKPPGALSKGLLDPALCVRMTLYRSVLQPQGSRYAPLAQVELSRDGRQ